MLNKISFYIKKNLDNLIISLICCIPMISFILNIDNIIPCILSILLLITIIYKKFKINHKILSDKVLLFYFILFAIFILINLLAFGFQSYSIIRVLYFCIYGIIPMLIIYIIYKTKSDINISKIFQYINFLYAIMSLFIYNIDFWKFNPQERMTISYYILPIFISVFFDFILNRKDNLKKIIIKVIIYLIVFFPYINFSIHFMSRGAILSIFICIYLTFISTQSNSKKIKIICTSLVILVFLLFFGIYILEFIHNFLTSIGISFSFIEKNLRLLQEHSIDNGRNIIYKNALIGIISHPITGNGIGNFEGIFGTYPHNFVLQSWYEGGILFMILTTVPIIYSIVRILFDNKISKNIKYFFIFIFSLSIIRLLLSFEYWKELFYWFYLFMSLLLIQKDIKNLKREEKK